MRGGTGKGYEWKRGGYHRGPEISLYGSEGKPEPLPNVGSWWLDCSRERFMEIVKERSANYRGAVDTVYSPDKFHGSK